MESLSLHVLHKHNNFVYMHYINMVFFSYILYQRAILSNTNKIIIFKQRLMPCNDETHENILYRYSFTVCLYLIDIVKYFMNET